MEIDVAQNFENFTQFPNNRAKAYQTPHFTAGGPEAENGCALTEEHTDRHP